MTSWRDEPWVNESFHQNLCWTLVGVFTGLFLGEYAAIFKIAANGFGKLLQMTVLPYITLSIITSLGALSYEQVKTLGLRAGAVVVGLWFIALLFAFVIPLAFPEIETASFLAPR